MAWVILVLANELFGSGENANYRYVFPDNFPPHGEKCLLQSALYSLHFHFHFT